VKDLKVIASNLHVGQQRSSPRSLSPSATAPLAAQQRFQVVLCNGEGDFECVVRFGFHLSASLAFYG
jgi:hypothetical protein